MLTLTNPRTGQVKRLRAPRLLALLFGPLYFVRHRVWSHAALNLLLSPFTFFAVWVVYAVLAERVLRGYHRARGWQIDSEPPPVAPPPIDRRLSVGDWLGVAFLGTFSLIFLLALLTEPVTFSPDTRATREAAMAEREAARRAAADLRAAERQAADDERVLEFTEADFVWDDKTLPHKKTIVAGVNKVHRENSRCRTIDPGTAYISSSKGIPSDPVFYVTCGTGADAFNAFFSKSEVENGAALAAAEHIDRIRAIDLCESYGKSKTNHPSTFSFSRIMDLAITEHPNGRTTVTSSFTAKNSFNLKLKHDIRCLLDANGLIEANISEAK